MADVMGQRGEPSRRRGPGSGRAGAAAPELSSQAASGRGEIVPPLRRLYAERPRRARVAIPVGGVTKRLFDILVSGAALIVLAPFLAAVAILVRATSPGPALFLQRRGGLKGRTFQVCKFRTMTTMDDGRQVAQATRQDARVTPIGAFLRKSSIDELPQLLNVFKGEMSVVGPRPHAIAHDKKFASIDPNYRLRHRARPGITGLAQVSGCRGLVETDEQLQERVRYDNAYIERWSLWLDLVIIVRTALLVLNDDKAF
jgi:putative colanic acid biosynthesis UDP-glucose lipid carrier transferase